MKKFLIKSFLFFLLVIGILSTVLITSGGYVDYFYEKFTTPKSKSFILGDSRSMQGLQPAVINKYLKDEYDLPMMNYSFTLGQIAYGPLYIESIKKKLDTTADNGLFIVTVNPWILSTREEDDEKKGIFFEEGKPPHNMNYVNHSPNFEYFIKNFEYFHFKSIIKRKSKLHKDGWLEESNLPKDSVMLNSWKKSQIKMYTDTAKKWKKSDFRLNSLESLVNYLGRFGNVVLLRMPIDQKIVAIEDSYWRSFDLDISKIATNTNTLYLNMTRDSNTYKTYDGNHLDKIGGAAFTEYLCKLIINTKNE